MTGQWYMWTDNHVGTLDVSVLSRPVSLTWVPTQALQVYVASRKTPYTYMSTVYLRFNAAWRAANVNVTTPSLVDCPLYPFTELGSPMFNPL